MIELTPLYSRNPDRMHALADQLTDIHAALPPAEEQGLPTAWVTRCGDWTVRLVGTSQHYLIGASATRLSVEPYHFIRVGGQVWEAMAGMTRFPEAHFNNMVVMASQSGLEWQKMPLSG